MGIENNRIVATLTVGELRSVIAGELKAHAKVEPPHHYVCGLKGIQKMFGVSHATAQAYKNTFLAPAVSQRGKNIIVDQEMAIRLFEEKKRRVVNVVEDFEDAGDIEDYEDEE